MKISLNDIAKMVNGEVVGDGSYLISELSPIDNIKPNSLVFAEGKENLLQAELSQAAAILVNADVISTKKFLIKVINPIKAFIELLNLFYDLNKTITPSIHPTAVIDASARLGENLFIGPYVTIGKNCIIKDNCQIKSHVSIGDNVTLGHKTIIHSHVTIYDNCLIGNNVQIHAATVVGSDGFGYSNIDGKQIKIPHFGKVIIHDNVEIGANTAIDRATLGSTEIGAGTKIDNLVQIAHGVKLGKNTIVCAFTGIAGSTCSGDNVVFAADVGVGDHAKIDDGVILGARTGVPPKKHLKKGNIYLGNPARPQKKALEQELSHTRIPIMRKKIAQLTEKVAKISAAMEKEFSEKF